MNLNSRVGGDPVPEVGNPGESSGMAAFAQAGSKGNNTDFDSANSQWTARVTVASTTSTSSRSADVLVLNGAAVGLLTNGVGDDGQLNDLQYGGNGVAGIASPSYIFLNLSYC